MQAPAEEADFLPADLHTVFVGECGLDQLGYHIEQTHYIQFLRLGLAFLRQNFEVPVDCQLGLSWFQYIGDPFPVIALSWNGETIPEGTQETANKMDMTMREFNRAVDWKGLATILNSNAS